MTINRKETRPKKKGAKKSHNAGFQRFIKARTPITTINYYLVFYLWKFTKSKNRLGSSTSTIHVSVSVKRSTRIYPHMARR